MQADTLSSRFVFLTLVNDDIVLRTASLAGETEQEREDKKIQWQIILANERFIEDQKTINERLTRTETSLVDSVNLLRSQQTEQIAVVR